MASKLVESIVGDLRSEPPLFIVRDRVIKDGLHICPNCQEEILEKGSYLGEDGHMYHGACGKPYRMPPPSPEVQAFLDQLKAGGSFTSSWPPVRT